MSKVKEIETAIFNLNNEFKAQKMSHKTYLAKHKALVTKWKKLTQPTFSQKLKNEGIKITKKGQGFYTYHGKNFTVDIINESCESTWWEACIWSDGVDQRVHDEFNEYNYFDRKEDVVHALYQLDKRLSA
jgi:hypothetical protein